MTLAQPPWLWLCVVSDPPPYEQTRTSWTVADGRVEPSPVDDDQFWIGVSDSAEGGLSRSAAERVAALFRHGTTPENTMPVLTQSMIDSIWVAFGPVRTDRFPAAAPAHLLRFLRAHRNGVAFVREGYGPNPGNHDPKLNRLLREHAASQPHGYRVTRVTSHPLGDDEPDDGGEDGVREPRRPLPDPPPIAAAVELDEDQP